MPCFVDDRVGSFQAGGAGLPWFGAWNGGVAAGKLKAVVHAGGRPGLAGGLRAVAAPVHRCVAVGCSVGVNSRETSETLAQPML